MPRIPHQGLSPLSAVNAGGPVLREPNNYLRGAEAKANVYQQIGNLGGQLSEFGDFLNKQKGIEETQNLGAQLADLRSKMNIKLKEQMRNAQPIGDDNTLLRAGGEDWDAGFQKNWDDEVGKLSEGISTPEGRTFFNKQVNEYTYEFAEKLAAGRQAIAGLRAKQTHKKLVESLSIDALNGGDMNSFLSSQRAYVNQVNALVENGGLSPLEGENFIRENTGTLANSALAGAIKRNPYRALKELNANAWDDYLGGADDKLRMLNAAESRIESLEHQAANLEKMKDDPSKQWGYLDKKGYKAQPISLENPFESIQERMSFIRTVQEKEGFTPQFLRPEEVKGLVSSVDGHSSADGARLFERLNMDASSIKGSIFAQRMGVADDAAEEFEDAKGQIGRLLAKEHPGVMVAFMNSGKAPTQVTQQILEGRKLVLASKGKNGADAFNIPAMKEKFDEIVPNSVFHEDFKLREAFSQAVYYHYLGKESRKEQNGIPDTADYQESVDAVLGPIIQVNGRSIPTFRSDRPEMKNDFVDEDRVKDIISVLSDDLLEREMGSKPYFIDKTTGKLRPIRIHKMNNPQFKVTNDGVYLLTDATGAEFYTKTGEAYEINMRKLDAKIPTINNKSIFGVKRGIMQVDETK